MAGLVTLFGGSGFLGRYVARELLKTGVRLRIAERRPERSWYVKPQAAVGQLQVVGADIADKGSVARALDGADTVINLIGILTGDFERVHVTGASNVASAAAAAGAKSLVHVSAIGADPASPSAYGASKGRGEAAVRAAFPSATIVRPSILFGPEDAFLNRFARMAQLAPVMPVIRGGWRAQPAYVADVARAVAAAALHPREHAGKTYELGGPVTMTMAELIGYVAKEAGHQRSLIEIPDQVGELIAKLGWLPGAPITADQFAMLKTDNVVSPGAAGFEAFGIEPTPLAVVAPNWLVRYRPHGRFSKRLENA